MWSGSIIIHNLLSMLNMMMRSTIMADRYISKDYLGLLFIKIKAKNQISIDLKEIVWTYKMYCSSPMVINQSVTRVGAIRFSEPCDLCSIFT